MKKEEAARISERAAERAQSNVITPMQMKFLDALLIDCGFSQLTQRNGYLSRKVSRDVKVLADITKAEATSIIGELQKRRSEERDVRLWRNKDED